MMKPAVLTETLMFVEVFLRAPTLAVLAFQITIVKGFLPQQAPVSALVLDRAGLEVAIKSNLRRVLSNDETMMGWELGSNLAPLPR